MRWPWPPVLQRFERPYPLGSLRDTIRGPFQNITDARRQASIDYTLPDTLPAAFAMFQFKYTTLL